MKELCFCSAAYGGWGIVRVGTLVPESHMLFACPYSCGRHNAIGAEQHGYKKSVSYLFIDERDIALGTVAEDIYASVDTILDTLETRPKVMLVYFSCVLYMSGFDWDAAMAELSERHSDIKFRACMMNPVAASTKKPPAVMIQKTLCSLWDMNGERDGSLNILGSYVELFAESELFDVLGQCGVKEVRHWAKAKTFGAYKAMGHSSYNLVLRPEGLLAAREMSGSMDFRFTPVSYDLREVERQYADIFDMLEASAELSEYKKHACDAIARTRSVVGGRKIAVGSSAVCRPFGLACALIDYGFAVSDVICESVSGIEKASYEKLTREHPEVAIHYVHDAAYVSQIGCVGGAEIAVGYAAGYYSGAMCVVDLMTDEGMFGYYGICRLMEMLRECVMHPRALEAMIDSYGLIV